MTLRRPPAPPPSTGPDFAPWPQSAPTPHHLVRSWNRGACYESRRGALLAALATEGFPLMGQRPPSLMRPIVGLPLLLHTAMRKRFIPFRIPVHLCLFRLVMNPIQVFGGDSWLYVPPPLYRPRCTAPAVPPPLYRPAVPPRCTAPALMTD